MKIFPNFDEYPITSHLSLNALMHVKLFDFSVLRCAKMKGHLQDWVISD